MGNTSQLFADPAGFFVQSYQRFGPIFRVKILGREYTVLAGPEAVQFFLTAGEKYFSREQFYRRFAHELGTKNFVLGAQGAQHARLRTLMRLGFSRHVAAPYIPKMIEVVGERARSWRIGQRLQVMETAAALAFEQYGWVMANRSLSDFFHAASRFTITSMEVGAMMRPALILYLPAYQKARRRIFALMEDLLAEHRASVVKEHHELDIINSFLTAKHNDGSSLSDRELISSALYGFVGCLVYVNRLISFLLYELLKNPQLLQQATNEADAAFANGVPDSQTLRRMRVLHGAYLETLRHHPIALGLPFLAEQDFEFEGFTVRRGQRVILSHVPVHFSPSVYSNPHCFEPARCLAPRNEHRRPNAYAPFGCGGRVCAATGLVEIITLATVATMLRTVRLQVEPPEYVLKTTIDPLPGPGRDFSVRVLEQRPATVQVSESLPGLDDQISAVLPELAPPQLEQVLAKARRLTHQPGQVIIHHGDVAEDFFIILEGEAEVLSHAATGETKLLSRLRAGDYFGEIGLLQGVRRTATVRAAATTPVKTLALDRATFTAVVAESDLVSAQIASVVRRRYMANRLAEALPSLSADQVGRFLSDFTLLQFDPGTVIIRQGEPADNFYLITKGQVEVVNHHPSGQDVVLGELGRGECFGEIGLLLGRPRTATVRAKAESVVEVLALGRESFARLIAESGTTREELAVIMSKRVLASAEKLNAGAGRTP